MNMNKLKCAIIAATLTATGGVYAAETFNEADTNNDGKISKDEYYGYAGDVGIYADWDTDNDGFISDEEFAVIGIDYDYTDWDTDEDSYLDAGEFYTGGWNLFDDNEDGHWDGAEWDDAGDAGFWDV